MSNLKTVLPRSMESSSQIGKPGELMVSYCNGMKCFVMHDGVTPGGCWRICQDECKLDCPTDESDEQKLVKFVRFAEGKLRVVYTCGTRRVFDIPDIDTYATLSEDGMSITFPDGRVYRGCCPCVVMVTHGCDYPTSPEVGDLHFDGGDQGWLEIWDGVNWNKKCLDVGCVFTYIDESAQCYQRWFEIEACNIQAGTFQYVEVTPDYINIKHFRTEAELKAFCECAPYAILAIPGECPLTYKPLPKNPTNEALPEVIVGDCWVWERCTVKLDEIGDIVTQTSPGVYTITHADGSTEELVVGDRVIDLGGGLVVVVPGDDRDSFFIVSAVDTDSTLGVFKDAKFYIRDTGVAMPDLPREGVTTGDTGIANAFDSWASFSSYMSQSLLFGTMTLDVEGDFNQGVTVSVNSSAFDNMDKLIIQGNPSDVSLANLTLGGATRATAHVTGSRKLELKDMTISISQYSSGTSISSLFAISGSELKFSGEILINGKHDNSAAGASPLFLMVNEDSTLIFGDTSKINVDFDAGTQLTYFVQTRRNGITIIKGRHELNILAPFTLTAEVFTVLTGGTLRLVGIVDSGTIHNMTSTGTDFITARYGYLLAGLSQASVEIVDFGRFATEKDVFEYYVLPANKTQNLFAVDFGSYVSEYGGYGGQLTHPLVNTF